MDLRSRELRIEQLHLDGLYARLDELSAAAHVALGELLSDSSTDFSSRSSLDALISHQRSRLAAFRAASERLCFGLLEFDDGSSFHLGRLGLRSPENVELLVDWRAPAAEPFYRATSRSRMGLLRRRHLRSRGRTVVSLEDDVLDPDRFDPGRHVSGEGALLSALSEVRTGRMGDIVGTIQAEQDQIIRSPLPGVLRISGGPGTGKTVVALHRAAYLLYTHRELLSRSGVLVVGPSGTFVRYVQDVLPSLGETDVSFSTLEDLHPGVAASGVEPVGAALLKGSLSMRALLSRALRMREGVLDAPLRLDVQGSRIVLSPALVRRAASRARSSRLPHNEARDLFAEALLESLVPLLAARRNLDATTQHDVLLDHLRHVPEVVRCVNRLWPVLSPTSFLSALWADPARLAALGLSSRDQLLLSRPRSAPFTVSDVPLLDELAELLGVHPSLPSVELPVFGHVVVDEAQELSPMFWRLLLRRCPSASMTVVGDPAQRSFPGGDWSVLDSLVPGRVRTEVLSVNYRTPGSFTSLAEALLASLGLPYTPSSSVRPGAPPRYVRGAPGDLSVLLPLLEELVAAPGTLALVVPEHLRSEVEAFLSPLLPGVRSASGPDALSAPVLVASAAEVKGLEFDHVVVLGPSALLAESPAGLFVALSRATSSLTLVHSRELPASLRA